MRKFIIWILLCALLLICGEIFGYTEDKFIFGVIASVFMWIPTVAVDDIFKH